MTRRRSSDAEPIFREGPALGNGEPTVIRPHEEPSWAEEFWRRQNDPHRPENYKRHKRFYGQLMGNLDDGSFMISMRNRLRGMEHDRAALAFWRWIKTTLFFISEEISLSGFEIKRLMRLSGDTPPDSLPDFIDVHTSYEDLLHLVSAAEAQLSGPAPQQGGTDDRA